MKGQRATDVFESVRFPILTEMWALGLWLSSRAGISFVGSDSVGHRRGDYTYASQIPLR